MKIKIFEGIKKVVTAPFRLVRNTVTNYKNGSSQDRKGIIIKSVTGIAIAGTLLGSCVADKVNDKKDKGPKLPTTSTVDEIDSEKNIDVTTTPTTTYVTFTTDSTKTTTTTKPTTTVTTTTTTKPTTTTITETSEEKISSETTTTVTDKKQENSATVTTKPNNNTNNNNNSNSNIDNNNNNNNNNSNSNIDNNNGSDNNIINDEPYMDESGLIWGSYQEYLQFKNLDFGNDYYVAPDGSYWDSEELYLESLSGNNNSDIEDNIYYDPITDEYYESYDDYLNLSKSR